MKDLSLRSIPKALSEDAPRLAPSAYPSNVCFSWPGSANNLRIFTNLQSVPTYSSTCCLTVAASVRDYCSRPWRTPSVPYQCSIAYLEGKCPDSGGRHCSSFSTLSLDSMNFPASMPFDQLSVRPKIPLKSDVRPHNPLMNLPISRLVGLCTRTLLRSFLCTKRRCRARVGDS